jgi:hypothetical protein
MAKADLAAFFDVFGPYVFLLLGDFSIYFITWHCLINNLAPCEEKSVGVTRVMCQELLQRHEGPSCAPSHR